jgi:hypothetical protein
LNSIFNDTLNVESSTFTAYFADFTNAKSFGEISEFALYPNPAKENLHLVNSGNKTYTDARFSIIDMNGRVLKEGILSESGRESVINISSIPSAVYMIRIYDAKGTIGQFRFVKTM